jgi:thioester reductase-like protein
MSIEEIFKKIRIIKGDCGLKQLGISAEDRMIISENVTLIYHLAATIRFDESLKTSVELNTRGTREMINLALECKKLEVYFSAHANIENILILFVAFYLCIDVLLSLQSGFFIRKKL